MPTTEAKRERLEPIPPRTIYPFHRATRMEACALYWVPVTDFPVTGREREWLMMLIDELQQLAVSKYKLRQEAFLQVKLVTEGPLKEQLQKNQSQLVPIMGLSRRPGSVFPPIPSEEDLEPIMKGKKKFNFNDHIADYCFWLVNKKERWRRDLFFGHGGMSFLFLAPDPKAAPPQFPISAAMKELPIFKEFNVEEMVETAFALSDDFGPRSKELLGKGLEENPQYPGLSFIVPLLGTRDFLQANPKEIEEWFQLFDFYMNESVADSGLVFASKYDLDEDIAAILLKMKEAGFPHPFYAEAPDNLVRNGSKQ